MPVPLEYPDTPAEPVELQIGGVVYSDPYTLAGADLAAHGRLAAGPGGAA
jgi:hypothetical protein